MISRRKIKILDRISGPILMADLRTIDSSKVAFCYQDYSFALVTIKARVGLREGSGVGGVSGGAFQDALARPEPLLNRSTLRKELG